MVSRDFRARLICEGVLLETGATGLYGRGDLIERIIDSISSWIQHSGGDEAAEIVRFPPVMARRHFESSGYFRSFPELVGTVHCFCGDEEDHRTLLREHASDGGWTSAQQVSDLVMVPAACYPVYPYVAAQGSLPDGGRIFDACSYCFRREPSDDPNRQQMFRMHERIFMGSHADARIFRERWLLKGRALAEQLALPFEIVPANDPFYGRIGRVMARSQFEQELKLELIVPSVAPTGTTACMSFNLHLTKMASAFGLTQANGEDVETCCVGFGLERLALAVLWHHGTVVADWPTSVRETLMPKTGALV